MLTLERGLRVNLKKLPQIGDENDRRTTELERRQLLDVELKQTKRQIKIQKSKTVDNLNESDLSILEAKLKQEKLTSGNSVDNYFQKYLEFRQHDDYDEFKESTLVTKRFNSNQMKSAFKHIGVSELKQLLLNTQQLSYKSAPPAMSTRNTENITKQLKNIDEWTQQNHNQIKIRHFLNTNLRYKPKENAFSVAEKIYFDLNSIKELDTKIEKKEKLTKFAQQNQSIDPLTLSQQQSKPRHIRLVNKTNRKSSINLLRKQSKIKAIKFSNTTNFADTSKSIFNDESILKVNEKNQAQNESNTRDNTEIRNIEAKIEKTEDDSKEDETSFKLKSSIPYEETEDNCNTHDIARDTNNEFLDTKSFKQKQMMSSLGKTKEWIENHLFFFLNPNLEL